jgi:arginine deiminase
MKFEIDQSGKIEQTNLDTVIALSDDFQFAIIFKKRSKRALQVVFREQNKRRVFIFLTFAALIALVLKEAKLKKKVIIDLEYAGHQDILKKQIIDYLKILKIDPPEMEFKEIGKNSPAHKLAVLVGNRKKKVDKIVKLEEVTEMVFSHKK